MRPSSIIRKDLAALRVVPHLRDIVLERGSFSWDRVRSSQTR